MEETYPTAAAPAPVPERRDALLSQLHPEGITPEERLAINQRFAGLVDVVVSWADESQHNIETITPLKGGFKNPVVMLTTAKGEQFVAKGFTEEEGLAKTRKAQEVLGQLFEEDERLIPKSTIFNETLFSEKAKGSPIKTLIAEAVKDPAQTGRTIEAFEAAGATLALIHERTEKPVFHASELPPEVAEQVVADREKVMRHLDELNVADLVDLSPTELEGIKQRIVEFTEPEYVSLVHGDAHLDQFFHEEGGATVEIVDYDDIREGDPMADLARLIASQRDWCQALGASEDLEIELTRAIGTGYEKVRLENGRLEGKDELDAMHVVAYEVRLYLIQLKAFEGLRQRLGGVETALGLSEHEVMDASADQDQVIMQHLTPEDRADLVKLRAVSRTIKDILHYLRPPAVEAVEDHALVAA